MKKEDIKDRKEDRLNIIIKLVGIIGIFFILVLNVTSKPIKDVNDTENISIIPDLSIGSTLKDKKLVAYAKEPTYIKIDFLSEPPKISEEKLKQLEDARKRFNLPGPDVPYDKKPVGPIEPPTYIDNIYIDNIYTDNIYTDNNKNKTFNKTNSPLADSDFIIYRNSPLGNAAQNKDYVNEPAAGTNGDFVFYTGNWYAARSTNGGNTFTWVNPWQGMPTFCCDQDVIYDPTRDIFIWYRQGLPNANGVNIFRLGISNDNGANWFFYDFMPTDVDSSWTNQWWDYPQLALTKDYLYISSNMFDNTNNCNGDNCFTRAVLLELPLNGLRDHTNFGYGYYDSNLYTFGLASGAKDNTIYFATHLSNSKLRIFGTTGGYPDVYIYDRDIPAWVSGSGYQCPSPDGNNWCSRLLSKVTGGYISNAIGFMWTVRQGSGFPYPYIYIAHFRIDNKNFIDNQILWNSVHAFTYPNAYPNNRGDIGIDFFIGGGGINPNHIVGIDDDYTGYNQYNFRTTNWGTNGSLEWGDYIRVRPYIPASKLWVATGFTQQGGTTGGFTDPRYIIFGRERDRIVPIAEAVDLSSQYVGQWTTGGDAYWYGATHDPGSYYGNDIAMSDTIRDNEDTWMQNTIQGPGILYFMWATGSESNFDFLEFYIDGVLKNKISGLTSYLSDTYPINIGKHTIKWRYVKDGSVSNYGDIGLVDYVRFFPEASPEVIVDPNPMNYGGASKITVHVTDPLGRSIPGADIFLTITGGDVISHFGKADSNGYFTTTYWPPLVTSTKVYQIKVTASKTGYDMGEFYSTITVRPRIYIATVVDNNEIKWSTGGHRSWFGEDTTYYYFRGDAAQSGPIIHNQYSWVQGNITGPGKLWFWWRTESEYKYDLLKFYIDGIYKTNISGYTGWKEKTYTIGPGKHKLKWNYTKDRSISSGYDAGWLDKIGYVSLVVNTPDGGNVWKRGTTHRIKWNYTGAIDCDVCVGPNIRIELYKGGLFNKMISSNRPIGNNGYGYYDWYISTNQEADTKYKIKITSIKNPVYNDYSDKNFTISIV